MLMIIDNAQLNRDLSCIFRAVMGARQLELLHYSDMISYSPVKSFSHSVHRRHRKLWKYLLPLGGNTKARV